MNEQASLSLDQAPPIEVPLRFFITAPLFALTAAVHVAVAGAGFIQQSLESCHAGHHPFADTRTHGDDHVWRDPADASCGCVAHRCGGLNRWPLLFIR